MAACASKSSRETGQGLEPGLAEGQHLEQAAHLFGRGKAREGSFNGRPLRRTGHLGELRRPAGNAELL